MIDEPRNAAEAERLIEGVADALAERYGPNQSWPASLYESLRLLRQKPRTPDTWLNPESAQAILRVQDVVKLYPHPNRPHPEFVPVFIGTSPDDPGQPGAVDREAILSVVMKACSLRNASDSDAERMTDQIMSVVAGDTISKGSLWRKHA